MSKTDEAVEVLTALGLPRSQQNERSALTLLAFYLLEKCIYEVNYEIDNRPDWVAIPVAGLARILEEDDAR